MSPSDCHVDNAQIRNVMRDISFQFRCVNELLENCCLPSEVLAPLVRWRGELYREWKACLLLLPTREQSEYVEQIKYDLD